MNEILVIRWKSIGDVAFTLPAVNRLRAHAPDARITFLVSRENRFVVDAFPGVDEVWTIDRALFRGSGLFQGLSSLASVVGRIRSRRFSLVVDLQGYGETAALSRWSGAPERWGCARRGWRRSAYTRNEPGDPQLHPAERHVRVLESFGIRSGPIKNRLRLQPERLEQARGFLQQAGLPPDQPRVWFQPCTSAAEKNWPIDRYIEVARRLRSLGARIVFGGGPADQGAFRAAREAGFAVTDGLPAATSLALLSQMDFVIGGDTGFLHLAVAVDRPVLMVCRRGPLPLGHPEWALVAPRADILQLSVEAVAAQAAARFQEAATKRKLLQ